MDGGLSKFLSNRLIDERAAKQIMWKFLDTEVSLNDHCIPHRCIRQTNIFYSSSNDSSISKLEIVASILLALEMKLSLSTCSTSDK